MPDALPRHNPEGVMPGSFCLGSLLHKGDNVGLFAYINALCAVEETPRYLKILLKCIAGMSILVCFVCH